MSTLHKVMNQVRKNVQDTQEYLDDGGEWTRRELARLLCKDVCISVLVPEEHQQERDYLREVAEEAIERMIEEVHSLYEDEGYAVDLEAGEI